jgi:hypothetical protein
MGNIFKKLSNYIFENKNTTDYQYDRAYNSLEFFDIDVKYAIPIETHV